MDTLTRDAAKKLFDRYRRQREGISDSPEMAFVCLICGSTHVYPKDGDPHQRVCRSCGFAFYRYDCPSCGKGVDGRDPRNVSCLSCGLRLCSCGTCGCPAPEWEEKEELHGSGTGG